MVRAAALDLHYCTEWRRWLWTEPIRWVLGDVARFRNKRVLDLGCRLGKMSCYFASLGAFVDRIDLFDSYLNVARSEAEKWGLSDRVDFFAYNGKLHELAGGYDFVFTKSTLVIMEDVGKKVADISTLLSANGEYLAVENLAGGPILTFARKYILLYHWQRYEKFKGLDDANITDIGGGLPTNELPEVLRAGGGYSGKKGGGPKSCLLSGFARDDLAWIRRLSFLGSLSARTGRSRLDGYRSTG